MTYSESQRGLREALYEERHEIEATLDWASETGHGEYHASELIALKRIDQALNELDQEVKGNGQF